ncbi:unnamed protein product [Phytophthora fragariaefolia]|uniref:Unnamed protein product n=1 Tax=Phytophthora fragariaefolia TaxID=1490495 RepID=A0A9W6YLJ1_9STRA|nr:unnamed protein product [Phytophthora fragariaefolia]
MHVFWFFFQGSDRRENDWTTNEELPVGAAAINAAESDDMREATRGPCRWGSAWWNAENRVEIDISRECGGGDVQLPTVENNQGLTLNNEHRGDPSISREASATSIFIQTRVRRSGADANRKSGSSNDVTLSRTPPPPLIHGLFLKKLIAYFLATESWMKEKLYRCVRSAHSVGRVCRILMKSEHLALFQVMLLDTQFQTAIENVNLAVVQRGIENYQALIRLPDKTSWRDLTGNVVDGKIHHLMN